MLDAKKEITVPEQVIFVESINFEKNESITACLFNSTTFRLYHLIFQNVAVVKGTLVAKSNIRLLSFESYTDTALFIGAKKKNIRVFSEHSKHFRLGFFESEMNILAENAFLIMLRDYRA